MNFCLSLYTRQSEGYWVSWSRSGVQVGVTTLSALLGGMIDCEERKGERRKEKDGRNDMIAEKDEKGDGRKYGK